jgi:hypothetical protein
VRPAVVLSADHPDRHGHDPPRRATPRRAWVAVDKDYQFDTQDGTKSLADLFEGRSQLLAYNIMFGPAYSRGACPGCASLGDELGGTLVHLNHRDVTLICLSRAPIDNAAPAGGVGPERHSPTISRFETAGNVMTVARRRSYR